MTHAPVAYFIFNRPVHTKKTFAAIREQRPSKLFIIADGPRHNNATDHEQCARARKILDNIDWPCEVHRNYSEVNLGLKRRISSGLDWVFKQVDRAIILEDDCLAHPDFFGFCNELLDRYAEDERVSVITGNNFQNGVKRGNESYYFSKYNHCWGWATWRRAWKHYDGGLSFWSEWRRSADWVDLIPGVVERRYWESVFDQVHMDQIDTWDYPWMASVWRIGGLTATPNVNLVSNIGFGSEATHTVTSLHPSAALATEALGEIQHSSVVKPNLKADEYVFTHHFLGHGSRLRRLAAYMRIWPLKCVYSFVKLFLAIKKVR